MAEYSRADVVEKIRNGEGLERADLRQINLSNLALSKSLRLHLVGGKRTESRFPEMDLYVYRFDEFKLYFCLRGQVCTFLRVEANG